MPDGLKDITPAIIPGLGFIATGLYIAKVVIKDVVHIDKDIREALRIKKAEGMKGEGPSTTRERGR